MLDHPQSFKKVLTKKRHKKKAYPVAVQLCVYHFHWTQKKQLSKITIEEQDIHFKKIQTGWNRIFESQKKISAFLLQVSTHSSLVQVFDWPDGSDVEQHSIWDSANSFAPRWSSFPDSQGSTAGQDEIPTNHWKFYPVNLWTKECLSHHLSSGFFVSPFFRWAFKKR